MLLFQKQTEINGIRQQLWQFCKRIDYHAIFIHIRVKHQTELFIRSKVQLYLLFPTNNVRRNKTSDIQRTQLFQCSITILMVASGLTSGRNIQFRHHGINHNVSMLISLLCTGLSNNINNSTWSRTTGQTSKNMNINLIFVGQRLHFIVLPLQSRKILVAICSKKNTSRTTFLSGSLPHFPQRILHWSTILHNSLQSGIIGYIIQNLFQVHRLNIHKLTFRKRSILPHHTERRITRRHHLTRRIDIYKTDRQFVSFFIVGKFLINAFTNGLQYFTACTAYTNQDVVRTFRV